MFAANLHVHSVQLRVLRCAWHIGMVAFLTSPCMARTAAEEVGTVSSPEGLPPERSDEGFSARLSMVNDYLTNNTEDDDFFTFGLRAEGRWKKLTVRFEENGFTDSADGLRYDESHLAAGMAASGKWTGKWQLYFELGATHIGRGVFGQDVQNDLHRLVGDRGLELDYIEGLDELYLHVLLEAGLPLPVGFQWQAGPLTSLHTSPGYRTNFFAGLRATWSPRTPVSLDLATGARFADTELELLKPHLESASFDTMVHLYLPFGFFATWSLNRYGTDREHVSFGWQYGGAERFPARWPRSGLSN